MVLATPTILLATPSNSLSPASIVLNDPKIDDVAPWNIWLFVCLIVLPGPATVEKSPLAPSLLKLST